MDLYEALKSGTTPEELVATFHKDLEAAQKKYDKEAQSDKALDAARGNLAGAICVYAQALFGEKMEHSDVYDVEQLLKDKEEEIKDMIKLTKELKELADNIERRTPKDKKPKTDDDILKAFLGSF